MTIKWYIPKNVTLKVHLTAASAIFLTPERQRITFFNIQPLNLKQQPDHSKALL